MLLQIYNLDGSVDEAPICTLPSGEHIIGRGDLLKCHDKRASRSHAVIKIEDNTVTITSIHQNPCFYQSAESTTVVILTQDSPTEIKDGDKFGMFPDQFWFKTKFVFDSELSDQPKSFVVESSLIKNDQISASKRQMEEDLNESSQSKIPKLENGTLEETSNNSNENTSPTNGASHEENHEIINGNVKEALSGSDVETEAAEACNDESHVEDVQINENDVNTVNLDEPVVEVEETTEVAPSAGNIDDQVASSSGTPGNNQDDDSYKKPRDRCWYGENCFRKSTRHKQEFSHRGDPDYDSDPNDFRPICYYGAQCYRKNKDHLKQFKHPRTTRKPPRRRERKKKMKDPKKCKATANESSEDDYDYDDPFLNDDSEDDYQEESWSEDDSDDEDWAESGDEDTGSLMKEAKRFMKQKEK